MVFRALSVSLKTVMSSVFDLVASIDGYHGDSAVTIPIGHVKPDVMKLLKVTEEKSVQGNRTSESWQPYRCYRSRCSNVL